jgi:hypothetical protein
MNGWPPGLEFSPRPMLLPPVIVCGGLQCIADGWSASWSSGLRTGQRWLFSATLSFRPQVQAGIPYGNVRTRNNACIRENNPWAVKFPQCSWPRCCTSQWP